MTDKVVQLVDAESNNIFPVAGSLKSGSVTTNTIDDGAVTADKIDASTLPGKTFAEVSLTDTKRAGSTYVDFSTYTVPQSGLYAIRIAFSSEATNTNHSTAVRIVNGSTTLMSHLSWGSEAWSGNHFCNGYDTMVFWLNEDDVITPQGLNNNWTGNITITMQIQQIY